MTMNEQFDPKGEDFDAHSCWKDANCHYVDELQYSNPMDDDYDEVLYCDAPFDYACPLYAARIEADLNDIEK